MRENDPLAKVAIGSGANAAVQPEFLLIEDPDLIGHAGGFGRAQPSRPGTGHPSPQENAREPSERARPRRDQKGGTNTVNKEWGFMPE